MVRVHSANRSCVSCSGTDSEADKDQLGMTHAFHHQLQAQLPQQLHQQSLLCLVHKQPGFGETIQQQPLQRHTLSLEQNALELPLVALPTSGPTHSSSPSGSEQPQLQSADSGLKEAPLSSADGRSYSSLDSELCLSSQHCYAQGQPDETEHETDAMSLPSCAQLQAVMQSDFLETASGSVSTEVCFCLLNFSAMPILATPLVCWSCTPGRLLR